MVSLCGRSRARWACRGVLFKTKRTRDLNAVYLVLIDEVRTTISALLPLDLAKHGQTCKVGGSCACTARPATSAMWNPIVDRNAIAILGRAIFTQMEVFGDQSGCSHPGPHAPLRSSVTRPNQLPRSTSMRRKRLAVRPMRARHHALAPAPIHSPNLR